MKANGRTTQSRWYSNHYGTIRNNDQHTNSTQGAIGDAQNNLIKFMQHFKPDKDVNNLDDAPDFPMQTNEVDAPINQAIPDAGTRSCG